MSQAPVRWRDRLRYHFENTLNRGTVALIGWLALLSALIVLCAAVAWVLLGLPSDPNDATSAPGVLESAWQALMHALDAGNLAADQGWGLRVLMLLVTVGGIFIVSSLIGALTSGLQTRLDELRKGRSRVIESNHTLILGWNSKIYSIIGELILANANQRRPRVVILAPRDKVAMEDELRARFADTGRLRVICRSGDPLDLDDLLVVNPQGSRSIIVLAPENDSPDMHVIKSVLALTNHPQRRTAPYHIVAEIRDSSSMEAARLVGGQEAMYVQGDELIARVTAQTCRQSGLSVVYTELLDFAGSEFYVLPAPALLGRSYREALVAYPQACVIGVLTPEGASLINPAMDRVLQTGEQIIALALDDDALLPQPAPAAQDGAIVQRTPASPLPERTLILGWNNKAAAIIRELDHYVAPGSELVVLCQQAAADAFVDQLGPQLQHQRLRLVEGDITSRAVLDCLELAGFQHIVVLSDPQLPLQHADAHTLIALLHVRNIVEAQGLRISIVSEMMDLRNRALAQVARADDFIVSDKLVSLLLSQLAENRQLQPVFEQLFSADGAEIYLRPISDYIQTGLELDFYTLIEAAARHGETAIGYRRAALSQDAGAAFGVCLNPLKSERVRFAAGDSLIVLAEG